MRSWTNYHGHCNYCDGRGEMEAYIKKAIEYGMKNIGISSHAPVPFNVDWTMSPGKLNAYVNEIDALKAKYADEIPVYKSLEVDYIPNAISVNSAHIRNAQLDYSVGSIHFVDFFKDGTPWAIDGPVDEFKSGLDEIFAGDMKAATLRFFQLQKEMLDQAPPTILGHFDKMKMHNRTFGFFNEEEDWYLKEVKETLDLAQEKNVIVEINTKAIGSLGVLYPGPEIFSFLKDKNVPITINSDAHDDYKLVLGFAETAQLLNDAGITQCFELLNGDWQAFSFNKDGIFFD